MNLEKKLYLIAFLSIIFAYILLANEIYNWLTFGLLAIADSAWLYYSIKNNNLLLFIGSLILILTAYTPSKILPYSIEGFVIFVLSMFGILIFGLGLYTENDDLFRWTGLIYIFLFISILVSPTISLLLNYIAMLLEATIFLTMAIPKKIKIPIK